MTDLATATTADFEGWLVDHLRGEVRMRGELPGFQHAGGVAGLLLAYGRLFTPAPWPDGGDPPGIPAVATPSRPGGRGHPTASSSTSRVWRGTSCSRWNTPGAARRTASYVT